MVWEEFGKGLGEAEAEAEAGPGRAGPRPRIRFSLKITKMQLLHKKSFLSKIMIFY